MPPEIETTTMLQLAAGGYLLLAAVGGVVSAALAFLYPDVRRRFLPLERLRPGNWTGGDVLMAFVFALLAEWLVQVLFDKAAFFSMLYDSDPGDMRRALWSTPFVLPLTLALLFTFLHMTSGAYPSDLGLSASRWPANYVLGYLAFLAATPVVLGLFAVLQAIFPARQAHVFTDLARPDTPWWEWSLLLFSAAFVAPILEELLFRGLVQGWLRRGTLLGQLVFVSATWTIGMLHASPRKNLGEEISFRDFNWSRVAFTAILVIGYIALLRQLKAKNLFMTEDEFLPPSDEPSGERIGPDGEELPPRPLTPAEKEALSRWHVQDVMQQRHKTWFAIFGSSAAFALSHNSWPDPIPLFVLGLVLGWLAHRTQNLVPCMVLHSVFNILGMLILFSSAHVPPHSGNDATTAVRSSLTGSTASEVPGSQLPRRR